MFDSLLDSLMHISSQSRIGFISDAFALAWTKEISAYDLFRLIWTLRQEKDAYVWKFLLDQMHLLLKCLTETFVYEETIRFFNRFIQDISKEIEFEEHEQDGRFERVGFFFW